MLELSFIPLGLRSKLLIEIRRGDPGFSRGKGAPLLSFAMMHKSETCTPLTLRSDTAFDPLQAV